MTDENKMVHTTYTSEPYNDGIRFGVSYQATYTEDGEEKNVTRENYEEWMTQKSYDLTTWGNPDADNVDAGGIEWILKKDPNATIKITKIQLDNFNKLDKPIEQGGVAIPVDYKFTSATVNNEVITEIKATGHNATFYKGSFTVKNHGAQPCNINRFEIPEQYRGGYVRIDLGEEPEHNWGLNLAFEDESGKGVDGGWKSINDYVKKVGFSRYYKIPEEATTMNPQIWKNEDNDEDWTIDVDGFYLTTGFDYSQVYTDKYFPLESEKLQLFFGEDYMFDNSTKTITFGGLYNRVGWKFKPGINTSQYKYMVIVTNPNAPGYVNFRTQVNGEENIYVPRNENDEDYHLNNDVNYFTWNLGEGKLVKDGDVNTILNMSEVSSIDAFSFWTDFCGKDKPFPLSSVFLTNVEPNWKTGNTHHDIRKLRHSMPALSGCMHQRICVHHRRKGR